MPSIKPFKGIFYNHRTVNIDDVVAPPYDVISPELQTTLYDRHPANVVRLIYGREEDRYTSAARYFSEWQASGILERDEKESVYLLLQNFLLHDGSRVERKGFIAACELEDIGKGSIVPHERTLANPKEDRFKLFHSTKAMFSQIFSLYNDPHHVLDIIFDRSKKTPPMFDVVFEEIRNRIWKVSDNDTIELIRQFLADRRVYIADGHHRYETALIYRDSMRLQYSSKGTEPFNFVPMFFTNMYDPGLIVLPTHRILHSIPAFSRQKLLEKLRSFFITETKQSLPQLESALRAEKSRSFGLIIGNPLEFILLRSNQSNASLEHEIPNVLADLDVTILHSIIIKDILGVSEEDQIKKKNLDYVKEAQQAYDYVHEGKAQAAFLMNPTRVDQVCAVAESGYTMPQKSTYFYPKLLSGLVMYSFIDR